MVLIHPRNLSRIDSKHHTLGPRLSRCAKLSWGGGGRGGFTLHHWVKNLHDAAFRPRRMKFPRELNGYVFKTKASHLDGGHRLWSGMERDGLRHTTLPKTLHMKMATTTQSIPARSSPGTRTAPSVADHQGGGEKYATDGPTLLRARNNITVGTWIVRSLRAEGKVEELTHEMKRYRWIILGLCYVRWKKILEEHLLQKATSSSSVAVSTDMSMELDSSFTKTL